MSLHVVPSFRRGYKPPQFWTGLKRLVRPDQQLTNHSTDERTTRTLSGCCASTESGLVGGVVVQLDALDLLALAAVVEGPAADEAVAPPRAAGAGARRRACARADRLARRRHAHHRAVRRRLRAAHERCCRQTYG